MRIESILIELTDEEIQAEHDFKYDFNFYDGESESRRAGFSEMSPRHANYMSFGALEEALELLICYLDDVDARIQVGAI